MGTPGDRRVMVRALRLLSRQGMVVLESRDMDDAPAKGAAMALEGSSDQEITEPILMWESMKLGPFQTKIIEGKIKPLLGESVHMMVAPLKAGEAQ